MSPDAKITGKCYHAVLYGAWGPYGVVDHMGYMVLYSVCWQKCHTAQQTSLKRFIGKKRIQEGGCLPVG